MQLHSKHASFRQFARSLDKQPCPSPVRYRTIPAMQATASRDLSDTAADFVDSVTQFEMVDVDAPAPTLEERSEDFEE